MKCVIALIALFVAVAVAVPEDAQYESAFVTWMQEFNRAYDHEEFRFRFEVFRANMDFVNAHNADETKTFQVSLNKFADLTAEEFGRIYNGMQVNADELEFEGDILDLEVQGLPSSFDWNSKGAVTAIKNQAKCGSCWSFSTTGSTEGCHQISGNSLVGLSEKNLMDCSWAEGNQGCNGGLMTAAMKYIIKNGGIDTESSYPYNPVSSHDCKFSKSNVGATLKSFSNVQKGSESSLQQAVSKGPVSVAIDASHNSFQLYHSGVYYEPACSSSQLDHGVLAAGWGVDSGKDYWVVKNSWGTGWGQNGWIWMSRNRNNNCGIATMATLPSC